jgi:hypothetical protein
MDNLLQIDEIKKYQRYLQENTGEDVDEEMAALIWIRKYANQWRSRHTSIMEQQTL